jgi:hypothetical protein
MEQDEMLEDLQEGSSGNVNKKPCKQSGNGTTVYK